MVFPSLPVYLDHPDWQQQVLITQQQQYNNTNDSSIHPLPPPCPQPAVVASQQHQFNGGGGSGGLLGRHMGTGSGSNMLGSIRPGSMVDRARLAKLPLPVGGLKCPRCESTNTKFCYFNNYSLSQPRHFCKACRRYWTRGGALRSVPVGGGCRRNNRRSIRGKSSCRSKYPVSCTMERREGGGGIANANRSSSGLVDMSTAQHDHRHGHNNTTTSHLPFHPPQLTYLPSFHGCIPGDIGPLNLQPRPPAVAGDGDGGMNFVDGISSLTTHQQFSFLSSDLGSHPTNIYQLYSALDHDQGTQGNVGQVVLRDGGDTEGLISRDNIHNPINPKGFDSGGILSCGSHDQITPPPPPSSVKMVDNIVNDQGLMINSSKNSMLLGLDSTVNQRINNSTNHEDQQYNWDGSCTPDSWTDLSNSCFTQSSSATDHHLL